MHPAPDKRRIYAKKCGCKICTWHAPSMHPACTQNAPSTKPAQKKRLQCRVDVTAVKLCVSLHCRKCEIVLSRQVSRWMYNTGARAISLPMIRLVTAYTVKYRGKNRGRSVCMPTAHWRGTSLQILCAYRSASCSAYNCCRRRQIQCSTSRKSQLTGNYRAGACLLTLSLSLDV